SDMIIYEVHVGTMTPAGTFTAIIDRLDDLLDLGINTIELMPVAQFPGDRNWGYDGVYPFAVQNSYGGPQGLKTLVNACHQKGIVVLLDVVYNHLGPEGNYLADFAPYFTDKYKTPWGNAINFDDAYNQGVRNYFIENALYWARHYHIDGLRLDAVHAIYDFSATPFLQQLAVAAKTLDRPFWLIAESDLNDSKLIRPPQQGGYYLEAQWSDDFHHAVHALLTGERAGYYQDFGTVHHLAETLQQGFYYSWKYSAYRKRYHGNDASDLPGHQFVVCIQNHDQVGNRMNGERLSALLSFESLKTAAGVLMLSPFVPLIFMGEEYAEESPFLYFVSHTDPQLVEAVRQGRKNEFVHFKWNQEPPDPQSRDSFERSKLDWTKRSKNHHQTMVEFYKRLVDLRKNIRPIRNLDMHAQSVHWSDAVMEQKRWLNGEEIVALYNFNDKQVNYRVAFEQSMTKLIDSSEEHWSGPGTLLPAKLDSQIVSLAPQSFAVYYRKGEKLE
ncbi:malto-oligosyltrehalose trehalohydrolase, partial [candidate division KSB1 bacterium]|nr:malto-oligosyltrehalose trehalohydrolase [candidate division KSB1 bacterium]